MNVMIIATQSCMHRPNLGRELQALGIPYQVFYVEDRPDLAEKFAIRHSPNLVVNDEVVFRRQPTEAELRDYFGR